MSEIRVDNFKAEDGISAPSFPNGIQVTGIVTSTVLDTSVTTLNVTGGHVNVGSNIQLGDAGILTATTFKGNIEGTTGTFSGNVSVGGTLTYEDVTNIDSVGIVTARTGVITPNVDVDDFISVGNNIHLGNAGVVTATSFSGNGSALTGITQTTINSNAVERIITGSNTANTLNASTSLTYDGVYLAHTGTSFRITATDTNASNALNYIQFNAGKCEYHSDQNAAVGSSGHLFTTDGTYAVKINASGIYPATNNNFDLGSSSLRWANVYTQDLKLSNEAKKDEGGNDVDGTWGDYTIQEGESDLYLINNRNGKKYKFMLKEVN